MKNKTEYRPLSLRSLHKRNYNRFFYAPLFLLILLLIGIFIPIQFKPSKTNALTGTVNPSILTFSSVNTLSSVSLVVDSEAGTFATSNNDEKIKFSIATNNYTGYTLRIKSSSGDTTLSNNEYSIDSINGITTLTDFRNPSNTNYNNKWGLMPSKYANGNIIISNTNAYIPAPNTTGAILNITTSANSSDGVSNPDNYTIGIGARINHDAPSGNYSTTAMILEYVANPITYSITYDANDGNNGTDTTNMPTINPETGSVDTNTTTVTLSNKIPEREGFVFRGWCTIQVADDASCTGTEYQPGDTYGIDFTVLNTTTLYARWTMANYSIIIKTSTGISSVSLNGTSCTNSTTGCEVTGLTYNQSYTLTGTLSEGYSFSSWNKSGSGSIADATTLATSFTVGMGTATITANATPNLYTCTKQYRLQNADGTFPSNYTADGTEQVYFGDTCSYSKTVTDYKGSTSGTNDAEASVSDTMTTSGLTLSLDLYRNTYGLTVSRNTTYISSASVTTTAVHGTSYYRWGQTIAITATANSESEFVSWEQTVGTSSTFDNYLSETTSFTMPKSNATIYANGRAMIYLQDATIDDCTALKSRTFIDRRDGQKYTAAILKDGGCYMTQNLRLGSDGNQITLTSSDSNVTSNFTLKPSSTYSNTFTSSTINQSKAYYPGDIDKGSYYNWYTATAGTGTSSTGANVNVSGSICPKGWGLPSQSEIQTLHGNYIPDYIRAKKLLSPNLPNRKYTGLYHDSAYYLEDEVYYWTKTSASTSLAYDILTDQYASLYLDATNKYYGMPIRCRLIGDKSSFTVSYNANGGSGTMNSQTSSESYLNLNSNTFTRPGYKFIGWSTDSNSTEPTYIDGGWIVSYKNNTELYAVWRKENTITFTYSGAEQLIILNADGEKLATITSSGNTATLAELSGYRIRPTKGTINNVVFTSGTGTIDRLSSSEAEITLGKGTATVNLSGTAVTTAMKNFTKANCQSFASSGNYNVYDERDGEVYSVRYINGLCVMTQNLRFTGKSLSTTTSNVGTNKTINYTYGYFGHGSINPATTPIIIDSGEATRGVWYNFAAASAMYITGDQNTNNSSYDICPKNWHLPTGTSTTSGSDFNKIVGNTTSGFQSYTANINSFEPSLGGAYLYRDFNNNEYYNFATSNTGRYWGASYRGVYSRWYLFFNDTQVYGDTYFSRWYAFYVRCVRTS